MSCIVAIETSTEHCSVALAVNGQTQTLRAAGVRQHAQFVLPMLKQLLAEAGLPRSAIDVIGYGRGPGAFTGVRLAVAVAQGLGFALDRPTFGVSSLQACASAVVPQLSGPDNLEIISILDARMGEFYVAAFSANAQVMPVAASEEYLLAPDALHEWLQLRARKPVAFVGNGLSVLPADAFLAHSNARFFPEVVPDAEQIVKLTSLGFSANQALPARQAQPIYVRDKVADTLIERAEKKAAANINSALVAPAA